MKYIGVTGPRIDEDCVVSTYSTSQSTSILGAYDSGTSTGTVVLHVLAWDARMVPVDLAYVIFIDFLALGVLGFCFCC